MTEQSTRTPADPVPDPAPEPTAQAEPVADADPAVAAGSADTAEAAGPQDPSAPQKPPRRILRAVARYTVVAAVFVGLGVGTAYGIASMDRTDVPGLATESDGRWDYPQLSLPALPDGAPRPYSEGNTGEVHHADLRRLLLPAPAGATVDKKLDGGWVNTDTYLSAYEKKGRSKLRAALRDAAPRHAVARGWTMPDGTSTRIYLVRFNSTAFAQGFLDLITESGVETPLTGVSDPVLDEEWNGGGKVEGVAPYVFDEEKPYGEARVRHGYLVGGDTLALVVQSREGTGKETTPAVPFHQTMILQAQLLG
ncbi:hypothetical protein ACF08W_04355 [Streptomyces sp. NPDC015144]|uniref:hypothetical protein n=1 Tax=Streptomyces sp. NPDC015144 TaxID=3364944 RepID=UPI0036F52884